jgi:hypothetical protein
VSRAFAKLNLRCNPFGELPPEDLAAVATVDLRPILDALADGLSVQLRARCGRGKSTHLRALQAHDPTFVYRRVWSREFTGQRPIAPDVPDGTRVLLLDEADHLPSYKRVWLLRRVPQVVLATHVDLSPSLRLAGHRSRIVDVARPADVSWLDQALNRRIAFFRREPGPVPRLDAATLADLSARFGDDLRSMERHLYEDFQTRSR